MASIPWLEQPYILTDDESAFVAAQQATFQLLCGELNLDQCKELSHIERSSRSDLDYFDPTLTYGEIEFLSLAQMLFSLQHRHGGIPPRAFYDLGSGIGKPVFAAALLTDLPKYIGFEKLSSLHEAAVTLNDKFRSLVPGKELRFENQDLFACDWTDAGLLFVNSTCFSPSMMLRIADRPVQPGTLALSLTHAFEHPHWQVLERVIKPMSWGEASVFVQQRIVA